MATTPPALEAQPFDTGEVSWAGLANWPTALQLALDARGAEAPLSSLGASFPPHYMIDRTPTEAADDLLALASLTSGATVFAKVKGFDSGVRIYSVGASISLARALRVLGNLDIELRDVRSYDLAGSPASTLLVHDMTVGLPSTIQPDSETHARVMATLQSVWDGVVDDDKFNSLVIHAGLSWWQANVLRAYAQYLRQAGLTFTPEHIATTLVEHPRHARSLVDLFQARFDPDLSRAESDRALRVAEAAIGESTRALSSFDQDVILGALRNCIEATVRTNAYREEGGVRRTALAFKLRSSAVETLTKPRPWSEIWVHSTHMEGIHLRFGPVARGGLRWSDRLEDFRTEVLGLVKAQQVKNAVIVPLGAKGGFVVKPTTGATDRKDAGLAAYRTFIESLLDVTDNVLRTHVAGCAQNEEILSPPRTRCYDGPDPYLVVAADKGTATFSDEANAISQRHHFWLGDAFASGGSVGFDHKAMGITARGAWESVKAHFHDLGVDVSSDAFTAVGIGDMSGDVFGNGMLLSRSLELIAAFDHRNIFLDPQPDAGRSFTERQRLFATPGSSWADYDPELISHGGGVYSRDGRSVPVSPEVAEALGIEASEAGVSPAVMIQHILQAPVDLLWNGGVGTFVKSSQESAGDAGDRSNDDIRVDARNLRVRVIGEGGNLGLTQRARIEFAVRGGKVNSDALDNSAGVDTSDHEVNLKILLDLAVGRGQFDPSSRTELLAACEEGVARRVLRHTRDQNALVAVETSASPSLVTVHERFLQHLESSIGLDRTVEYLPDRRELKRRQSAGTGLSAPENAVLCAYSKLWLRTGILASPLPMEPWVEGRLRRYFPSAAARMCQSVIPDHPLRPQIISTMLANEMVDRAGATFAFRAADETGASTAQVARAYAAAWATFDLDTLMRDIDAASLTAVAGRRARVEVRRFIDRATRWFLTFGEPDADPFAAYGEYVDVVAAIAPRLPELLRGRDTINLETDVTDLCGVGLPHGLANQLAQLLYTFQLLDVAKVSLESGRPAWDVADVRFALSERLRLDDLLIAIGELPRGTRWDAVARGGLRHDLYAAAAAITAQVVTFSDGGPDAARRLAEWNDALAITGSDIDVTIDDVLAPGRRSLAALYSTVRMLQALRLHAVSTG